MQTSSTHSLYCRCEGRQLLNTDFTWIPTLVLEVQKEALSYASYMPAHSVTYWQALNAMHKSSVESQLSLLMLPAGAEGESGLHINHTRTHRDTNHFCNDHLITEPLLGLFAWPAACWFLWALEHTLYGVTIRNKPTSFQGQSNPLLLFPCNPVIQHCHSKQHATGFALSLQGHGKAACNARSELFLTYLQPCFSWFSCNSSSFNWPGNYG